MISEYFIANDNQKLKLSCINYRKGRSCVEILGANSTKRMLCSYISSYVHNNCDNHGKFLLQ